MVIAKMETRPSRALAMQAGTAKLARSTLTIALTKTVGMESARTVTTRTLAHVKPVGPVLTVPPTLMIALGRNAPTMVLVSTVSMRTAANAMVFGVERIAKQRGGALLALMGPPAQTVVQP